MKQLLRSRQGTTLAELMAAMAVMCLVLAMSLGCVGSAASVTAHIRSRQEARLILSYLLPILRRDAETACGYVKLYERGSATADMEGAEASGTALEYLDPLGRPTVLSADGCAQTLRGGKTAVVAPGTFLRRRYPALAAEGDAWYHYRQEDAVCDEVFAPALYRGLFLKLEFTRSGEDLAITAALYRDGECRRLAARETVLADLRQDIRWTTEVTALK